MFSIDKPYNFIRRMNSFYDNEWLTWEPSVMEIALARNFDFDPTPLMLDQIEALKVCLRGNDAIDSPALFETVVRLFNGEPSNGDIWEGMRPDHLAYGFYMIGETIGHELVSRETSAAVRAYAASVLMLENIHVAPESIYLDSARPKLGLLSDANPEEIQAIESDFEFITSGLPDRIGDRLAMRVKETDDDTFASSQLVKLSLIAMYLCDKGATILVAA